MVTIDIGYLFWLTRYIICLRVTRVGDMVVHFLGKLYGKEKVIIIQYRTGSDQRRVLVIISTGIVIERLFCKTVFDESSPGNLIDSPGEDQLLFAHAGCR